MALLAVAGGGIEVLLTPQPERQRGLVHQGLSKGEVEEQLDRLASQAETFRVWQDIHAPVTLVFAVPFVWHRGAHRPGHFADCLRCHRW